VISSKQNIKQSEVKGVELRIQGIVQGVGFRPFIYNLAVQMNISGTVSNTGAGVIIQAVGDELLLESFITRISSDAPPLAQIHSVEVLPSPLPVSIESGFTIIASDPNRKASTAIPPDIALCKDCLKELLSPTDRRFNYPFINCTNCGPRFTIVETIPYDRPKTSMKVFPMCTKCNEEYLDPANRRFHAQPNACPACGPQISWHDYEGSEIASVSPIEEAVKGFTQNKIIAIRGLGGFHLAVNGCSEESIALLRKRKHRPSKPLAVMVANLETAHTFCHITTEEEKRLLSTEHPIVLLTKRATCDLPANLCPGVDDIGIMLPYTPLHHLLFSDPNCPTVLVMTSGNRSGQPICISNQSALSQLSDIADFFLLHNREILTRVDDSVTKRIQGSFRLFRRARGFSPSPILLSTTLPQVLGCGGGLKSTFCMGRDNLAFLSQHIGDLFNLESFEFYTESIEHHRQVFEIEPEIVVRDMHPDYMSSHYAEDLGLPVYKVQHHHAHAVSVMAEHGIDEPTIAIVLDGTGYGTDGTIWGGEILLSELTNFTRLGHLQNLPLPGGDKATAEPWRMALSALYTTFGVDGLSDSNYPKTLLSIKKPQRDIVLNMIENGLNSPRTSSCGRLFDAVAGLLGIRLYCDYEGHAAMELEAHALKAAKNSWKSKLKTILHNDQSPFLRLNEGKWEIISTEFVKMIIDKKEKGFTVSQIALDFHLQLICAISKLTKKLSVQHNIHKVVLSGGCLQNRLLMEGFYYALEKSGLHVYTGEKVPVNDGGISFGQIIIGGLQHVSRNPNAGNQSIR